VALSWVACGAGLLSGAAALDRFVVRRATWVETGLLLSAAVCLLLPDLELGARTIPAWVTDGAGATLLAAAVLLQTRTA
jgi:hypothetical protein